jgi:hypothetical protein
MGMDLLTTYTLQLYILQYFVAFLAGTFAACSSGHDFLYANLYPIQFKPPTFHNASNGSSMWHITVVMKYPDTMTRHIFRLQLKMAFRYEQ